MRRRGDASRLRPCRGFGANVCSKTAGGSRWGRQFWGPVSAVARGGLAEWGLVIRWRICHFGVPGGPGGPRNPLPPTFLKAFWAARGRPEAQNDRFFIKIIKPPSLKASSGSRRSTLLLDLAISWTIERRARPRGASELHFGSAVARGRFSRGVARWVLSRCFKRTPGSFNRTPGSFKRTPVSF